ncbi:MAG: hypothetical protein ACYDH9_26990 [Limisphaerales bacterium]
MNRPVGRGVPAEPSHEGRLTPAESDRVMRYARLVRKAVEVMGSEEAGREWLRSEQYGLGMAVPLEYAEAEAGGSPPTLESLATVAGVGHALGLAQCRGSTQGHGRPHAVGEVTAAWVD